jgi:beta-glucosidase-like glycosyl hydrolase
MTTPLPLLVPGIRLATGDGAAEERRALERAGQPWVAGFCLFGGEADQVRTLLARLRDAAGRPLFVASDMECGAGQQVRGLRRLPEAAVWGLGAGPDDVARFGAMTARDALSVGVDVLFAPVLDVMSEPTNPIVGSRAYGWDPARVSALGAAYLRGAVAGGAVPVAKHYPGHGATTADSHDDVPSVDDARERIEARDLLPFDAVLGAGICPAVMTAHVRYPALDPTGAIATFSRPILDRLRASARWPDEVAVFTDALCMAGARRDIGEVEAARRSLLAGCDLLLCPDEPEAVAAGLEDLPRDVLDGAAGRVAGLFAHLETARAHAVAASDPAAEEQLVADVAMRAVDLAWHGAPETHRVLVLDDDDVPERGRWLASRAAEVGVALDVRHAFGPPDVALDRGTVVILASVRSSKGPGGLRPAGREAIDRLRRAAGREGRPLRFVWCGPVPPDGAVHLPGAGEAVERALARRLLP